MENLSCNIAPGSTPEYSLNSIYSIHLRKDIPIDEVNVNANIKNNVFKLDQIHTATSVVPKMEDALEPLQSNASDTIELEFHNLSYKVPGNRKKENKCIINSMCGKFEPGKLIGILGPSGAGKTSLLNVLSGFKTANVSGTIIVNGVENGLTLCRGQSCYIMQDESLLNFLSVEESMTIAATLKLGDKISSKEKQIVISKTLDTMRLTAVKSTRVGKLSGGERKRLSIALELVNNPPLMFFDEPTSGLDSLNSVFCVNMLKDLARSRKTVVCTIHQPSAKIFEVFDQIYAMAEGRCIYDGTTQALIPFLSSLNFECAAFHNPADFLIEIASNQYGECITKLEYATKKPKCLSNHSSNVVHIDYEELRKPIEQQKMENTILNNDDVTVNILAAENIPKEKQTKKCLTYQASFYTQFLVLLVRTFKSIWRDSMLTSLRLGAHVLSGLLIGALYFKIGNDAANIYSNLGFLFFNLLFLLFTSLMPTIVTFPLEIPVMFREHFNHWYSLKSYYLSKTIADFPFQVILSVLYLIIVYFMTAQPLDATRCMLLFYFAIMTSLVAQSVGLAVGAAFDVQHAVFVGPILSLPALLFSGFFVTFKTMPRFFQWLSYLSYLRYGYEGTIIAMYGLKREGLECSDVFCAAKAPHLVFDLLGIKENFLIYDGIILFLYFLIVRIAAYYVLRWKLSRKG